MFSFRLSFSSRHAHCKRPLYFRFINYSEWTHASMSPHTAKPDGVAFFFSSIGLADVETSPRVNASWKLWWNVFFTGIGQKIQAIAAATVRTYDTNQENFTDRDLVCLQVTSTPASSLRWSAFHTTFVWTAFATIDISFEMLRQLTSHLFIIPVYHFRLLTS